ncbi:MAG TPA: prolyl oligopeptidase family serine peptidase [Candidatus Koribacter sp.]|jgi:dipeptidyl aminopeptidase/acylaminoacyl peptidase
MKRALVIFSMLICICLFTSGASTKGRDGDNPEIDISASANSAASMHPISLEEIVSFREVKEPRRSPDGARVAFLVTQAFLSCDCYRTALYVVSTAPGSVPTKLVEEPSLSDVRWTPDGNSISYLSSKSGSLQLWKYQLDARSAEPVFTHVPGEDQTIRRVGYHPSDTTPVGVFTYEWSPDGKQVGFISAPALDKGVMDHLDKDGILFDQNMDSYTLLTHQWLKVPAELWIYHLEDKTEEKLWQNKGEISSLSWSPDSTRIAVAYSAPPKLKDSMVFFNQDVGFMKIATKSFEVVADGEAAETLPQWSPDGKYLAYSSWGGYVDSPLTVYELATGKRRDLIKDSNMRNYWWSDNSHGLVFEAGGRGKHRTRNGLFLVTFDGQVRRITPEGDHVSDCDSVHGNAAACVWQSSNVPPSPSIVDLGTAKLRSLADVNPQLQKIAVGHVTELRWTNKYGAETTGYLLKPFNYVEGKRYPLLAIWYGFEGKFVTQAEWLSSYPAQAFARDGFAVLMVNYPPYDNWKGKDFARGSVGEGYSPLSSLESAVHTLVQEGIADPNRLGVMGISYGGFLTEFSITHSKLFKVSSLVDGGGYGAAAYAMSGHNSHENDERVLGGPPYGATLQNWLSFSPPYRADHVSGPVLMGFNDHEAFYGMEMRSALSWGGVPVEFWVYPGEGHIFTGPNHRLISMERNLDWFNFWLQDKEDPSPDKSAQYERWRAMRKQQAAKVESNRKAHPEVADKTKAPVTNAKSGQP